jgi:hypothetical protein
MSSAFYPLGMNSMPSSGYNHKSSYFNKQYISWKGTGINSNPVGTAPGHIRPLTNNDPGNVFPTGFGLPRPIKHFRKGRVIPTNTTFDVLNLNGFNPQNNNINISIDENALINYNTNRFVRSSKGTSLGGGSGGSGLLNDMQDNPGAFLIKLNSPSEINGVLQQNTNCQTCEGVGIVSNFSPNKFFLQENPEETTTNYQKYGMCCNDEKKAKRRAVYASTNLKKNYYTTTKQYLQNRCKTFDQKAFNFLPQDSLNNSTKPGSPSAVSNTYLANCQPNFQINDATENNMITKMIEIMLNKNILTQSDVDNFYLLKINSIIGFKNWLNGLLPEQISEANIVFNDFLRNPFWGMPLSGPSNPIGCQLVVYKPNNYQYAKQGAVDSSTRNLKLNVDTISTNSASINNYNNTGQQLVTANQLYAGVSPNISNLQKNKAPKCNSSTTYKFQNKRHCFLKYL